MPHGAAVARVYSSECFGVPSSRVGPGIRRAAGGPHVPSRDRIDTTRTRGSPKAEGGAIVRNRSGSGLIVAGAIVTAIGAIIVLVKVLQVPQYWVPLLIGLGLLLSGIIRKVTRG